MCSSDLLTFSNIDCSSVYRQLTFSNIDCSSVYRQLTSRSCRWTDGKKKSLNPTAQSGPYPSLYTDRINVLYSTPVLQSSDRHRLPVRESPPLDLGDSAAHTHTVHSLLCSRETQLEVAEDMKYAADDDLTSLETELGLPPEQTESGLLFSDPNVQSSANRCACLCKRRESAGIICPI